MPDSPADIALLCLDVDGVLTDGGIFIDDLGRETKRFHVRDGSGIKMWQRLGYHCAIITGRQGLVVRHRAQERGIELVIQGARDQREGFAMVLSELDLDASQAAVIADDLPELGMMKLCGYGIAVADASAEIKKAAHYVTVLPGGHGAVREAIEHLLREKGEWENAVRLYEK